MEIRSPQPNEVPQILALIRAKAKFDGAEESLKLDEAMLHAALFSETPKVGAVVAFIAGQGIGIATYFDTFSSFLGKPGLWLDDLYVFESHRKQGVGIALMAALCAIAKDKGCGRIDWTVAVDNQNGQDFYTAHGARRRNFEPSTARAPEPTAIGTLGTARAASCQGVPRT